jgi:hypothetical protein
MMKRSIPVFVILSLSPSQCTPQQIDSYCVLYRSLVTKKGDAEALTKLPRDQREIILGNEQLYRQYCAK